MGTTGRRLPLARVVSQGHLTLEPMATAVHDAATRVTGATIDAAVRGPLGGIRWAGREPARRHRSRPGSRKRRMDSRPIRISMSTAAILLPSSSGPEDDAQFQGEVVAVTPRAIRMLEVDFWRVDTVVLRAD